MIFSVLEKLKNSIFENPIIPLSLNIKNYTGKIQSAKTIGPHVIRDLIKFSIKFFFVGTIFTLKVFQILLFKGSSVLRPSQRFLGRKVLFLKFLKYWLSYKLRGFWTALLLFFFFWFYLTLSVLEKLKNLIFKISLISQTLDFDN